jgi:hypothetical protein
VIHLATMFKVVIFLASRDPWVRCELTRVRRQTFQDATAARTISFASPEDVLLHKLVWYRAGGETSDRQWTDIKGMMSIQDALDRQYINHWSKHLAVADLWQRVSDEAAAP